MPEGGQEAPALAVAIMRAVLACNAEVVLSRAAPNRSNLSWSRLGIGCSSRGSWNVSCPCSGRVYVIDGALRCSYQEKHRRAMSRSCSAGVQVLMGARSRQGTGRDPRAVAACLIRVPLSGQRMLLSSVRVTF